MKPRATSGLGKHKAGKPSHVTPAGREGLAVLARLVPILEQYIETFVTCPLALQLLRDDRRKLCTRIGSAIETLLTVTADTPEPPGGWVRTLDRTSNDIHHLVHQAYLVSRHQVGRRNLKKLAGGSSSPDCRR